MSSLAPIIIFTYQRLDHVQQVIDALKKNPEAKDSHIIVFSDEGKDDVSKENVRKVREYLDEITGFAEKTIVKQQVNQGIEKSQLIGISSVLNEYGKAIILEDDIVVGNQFLKFMNNSLEKYEHNKEVFSITGYSFLKPEDIDGDLPEFAFIQLTSAWGWATWKDRWDNIKLTIPKNEIKLLINNKEIRRDFDYGYSYSFYLLKQYIQNNFTWDFLWYWTSFKSNGLTLIPTSTMVNNIGMDGSGVHYLNENSKNRIENINTNISFVLPDEIKETEKVKKAVMNRLEKDFPLSKIALFKKCIFSLMVKFYTKIF